MNGDLVIIGAGGMGREALSWARDCFGSDQVIGFLDDGVRVGTVVADVPVLGPVSWLESNEASCVVGIGSSGGRAAVADRLGEYGVRLITLVHPTAYVGEGATLGEGSIIAPNVTISRDVTVGALVIVNYGTSIGHDTVIEDFVFIGPGVNIAGDARVRTGASVGIGASVNQGTTIGRWARVGGGAAVVDDIPGGVTAVGVPCRPLHPVDEDDGSSIPRPHDHEVTMWLREKGS